MIAELHVGRQGWVPAPLTLLPLERTGKRRAGCAVTWGCSLEARAAHGGPGAGLSHWAMLATEGQLEPVPVGIAQRLLTGTAAATGVELRGGWFMFPNNSVSSQRDREQHDGEYLCSLQTAGTVWVSRVVGRSGLVNKS